jgi:hypothetical protein
MQGPPTTPAVEPEASTSGARVAELVDFKSFEGWLSGAQGISPADLKAESVDAVAGALRRTHQEAQSQGRADEAGAGAGGPKSLCSGRPRRRPMAHVVNPPFGEGRYLR